MQKLHTHGAKCVVLKLYCLLDTLHTKLNNKKIVIRGGILLLYIRCRKILHGNLSAQTLAHHLSHLFRVVIFGLQIH